MEFDVPDAGYAADPGIRALYRGKSYRDYRSNGGELGLNGYVEELLIDDDLEELVWQRDDDKDPSRKEDEFYIDTAQKAVEVKGQDGDGSEE